MMWYTCLYIVIYIDKQLLCILMPYVMYTWLKAQEFTLVKKRPARFCDLFHG